MKQRKGLTTGLFLIVMGVVWILWNMGLLSFHEWEAVLRYWPALLVLAGLGLIVGGENARGLSVLLIMLAVVAGITYNTGKFTNNIKQDWWGNMPDREERLERRKEREKRRNDREGETYHKNTFQYDLTPEIKEGKLKVDGGVGVFILKEPTTGLFKANVESSLLGYNSSLKTNKLDSIATITLKQDDGDVNLKNSKFNNEANLMLNPDLLWTIDMNIGAGKAKLDLSPFRVKKLSIETGASALEVRLGDRVENMQVKIESGLAALRLEIPGALGCEVKVSGDLNLEDFEGLEKVSKGLYRTEGFSSAEKKAFLELEAGLSKIDIRKYE